MSKPIKSSDVVQKNIFGDFKKQAELVLKVLDAMEANQKKVLEATEAFIKASNQTSAKGIIAFNEAVEKSNKEISELTKVQEKQQKVRKELNDTELRAEKITTERLKLENKLKVANSDRIQQNEEIKILLSEQRKSNKLLARETLGLVGAYEKESRKLNELRKRYKDLAVEEKETTEEGKRLRKEITRLDTKLKDVDASVGQFQRNVGDYGREAQRASKNTLAFAAALVGLNAEGLKLDGILGANEEASQDLTKAQEEVAAGTQVVQGRIATIATAFLDLGKGVLSGKLSLQDFKDNLPLILLSKTAEATQGLSDSVVDAAEAAGKASDETFAFKESQRELLEEIARLNGEIEKQNALAGDNTLSFNQIEEAVNRARVAEERRSQLLKQIAAEEFRIIDERIKGLQDAEDAEKNELQIRALLDERSEKTIALTEALNAAGVERIETERALREVQRDRFERELDFAIDAFDAQKTVNERRIADENRTLANREAILERTEQLEEKSFANQIKLVQDFTKEKIDLANLAQLEDEEDIRNRLRLFNLDDITLGRILEIIRERKLALQDLEDARNDLNEKRLEQTQNIATAEQNIEQENFENQKEIIQEELDLLEESGKLSAQLRKQLNNEILELEAQRLIDEAEFQRKSVEQEKISEEEKAAKIKEINNKLANDLDRIDRKQAKNASDLRKEQLEEAKEFASGLTDAFLAELDKRDDAKIESLDKEIDDRQTNIERQQELADKGLSNTLAFEKEQLAKAEAERARVAEQQQKREERLAFIRAFASYVQNDPDNAAGKALAQTLIAKAIVTGFHDGNYTGDGGEYDVAGLVHKGEWVATAKTTKELGLKDMNQADFKSHFLKDNVTLTQEAVNFTTGSNTASVDPAQIGTLINKMDTLNTTLKNKREVSVNWAGHDERVIEIVENGMKTVKREMTRKPRLKG